jgi:PAS domain S-box-containing protein
MTREVERTARARYDRLAERIVGTIRQRFNTAAHLLHGAAAFPEASDRVTAQNWSVYLRRAAAQLDSGVVGLGYAEKVRQADADTLQARVRAEGAPEFAVERTGRNDWLYVVVAIEPRERNTGVLGLDVGSGTTRKSAAEQAAAQNEMVLSRRIRLDYDQKQVPGFLLFLPVYRKGVPLDTPERRLEAVTGWVYAPIRIDRLMAGITDVVAGQLDFAVFEGDATRTDALLYDADGHLAPGPVREVAAKDFAGRAIHTVQPMEIFGRRWTVRLSTRPEFEQASGSVLPLIVLAGGLVVSALGAILTWMLVHARRNALHLAEDMTAGLRRAEEEARRLALVASHTSSGVVLTDRDWRITWINEGFTRLFGYRLDEIRGRRPGDFMVGPETDPRTLAALDQAAAVGRPFVGEILNYAKDGRKVWIELEIQPLLDERRELAGYMGLQLDISPHKRLAAELRDAKEAADRANLAKGQFLAMMSHEIRTPMNGVIGMASLLLESPLTAEQRESVETIRSSGEALLGIINDILDFSKIESGRLELEHAEFNLRDCVEGAIDLLAPAAVAKGIDLLLDVAPAAPALVRGDPTRLRQVVVNLVGNAVKFTARGEVVVRVDAPGRSGTDVEVRFAVQDTGIGISAENMERLFKPFSQVEASTTRRFGGTGLGLAICRRIVELMGGRITVESVPGAGSTFSFTLRLQALPAGGEDPPAPAFLRGRRVLVVEDNDRARELLLAMLRDWAAVPAGTASGEAALAALDREPAFELVLIDLQLPGADGADLARRIREHPGGRALPIVLLAPPGRREAAAGRFHAIVTKPVKPSQLYDALVRVFRGAPLA